MGCFLTQQTEEPILETVLPVSRLEEVTKLARDPVGNAGDIPDHLVSCSIKRAGIRRTKR